MATTRPTPRMRPLYEHVCAWPQNRPTPRMRPLNEHACAWPQNRPTPRMRPLTACAGHRTGRDLSDPQENQATGHKTGRDSRGAPQDVEHLFITGPHNRPGHILICPNFSDWVTNSDPGSKRATCNLNFWLLSKPALFNCAQNFFRRMAPNSRFLKI